MELRCFIVLLGLGLAAAKLTGDIEVDVDGGVDWDIFNINKAAGLDLVEGDIEQDESSSRNSIIGDQYRWPTTVPYYLENNLDMNAKGVILKAFDQFRLKTCINFTPWKGEANYIAVFKGSGCFSSVGNRQVGRQRLSIGSGCDTLGIVEHEFLHALGFWHEQSRSDRDEYVDIVWDQIEPGKEHNFNRYDDKTTSALGVPYDYGSVMHYSKMSFNVGSQPTIVTKLPQFVDVIGQRMGFSESDLTKLNRLYNCAESSAFVESCNFEEENICGMIQGSGNRKWVQLSSVSRGPQSDFSNMGKCEGEGFFMHFSSVSAAPGDKALLESRWLYPKPGVQCLQFFLHNSGAVDDVLNVLVQDQDGKLTLVKSISGGVMGSWELHNVNLDVTEKVRLVFEAVRGTGASTAGFSLDDINVSSMKCPQHVWHIRDITGLMATTAVGRPMYSPRFLSPSGYSFQVSVYLNGISSQPQNVAIYLHLTSGPNDHLLQWPCPWHMATMALMDQKSDVRQQMNMHRMITTDPGFIWSGFVFWDNPSKVGSRVFDSDGSSYYRGYGLGTSVFMTHSRLKSRSYIKGGDAFFLFSLEDISDLRAPQSLPQAAVRAVDGFQNAPQEAANNATVITAVAGSVAAAMLVATMLVISRVRRRRQESDEVGMVQDVPEFTGERPSESLPSAFIAP